MFSIAVVLTVAVDAASLSWFPLLEACVAPIALQRHATFAGNQKSAARLLPAPAQVLPRYHHMRTAMIATVVDTQSVRPHTEHK